MSIYEECHAEQQCPSCGNPASVPHAILGGGIAIGANAGWKGGAHPCFDPCHPDADRYRQEAERRMAAVREAP